MRKTVFFHFFASPTGTNTTLRMNKIVTFYLEHFFCKANNNQDSISAHYIRFYHSAKLTEHIFNETYL